jgi:hypothetical protein
MCKPEKYLGNSALRRSIQERRQDQDFMSRLRVRMSEDAGVLRRLADD